MKFILLVFAYAMTILATYALPSGYGYGRQFPRPRRGYYQQPQQQPQAMMFSGFYGQPSNEFGHQGSMSAFANKDMVFTNSFAGEESPIYLHNGQTATEEEYLAGPIEAESSFQEELEVQTTTRRPQKPKKSKKRTTTAKPVEEEEVDESQEDDEDEEQETPQVPFRGAQQPNHPANPGAGNTFFPVIFGQSGNGKNQNGGHPGAAVAIANAFSTGKGGVASSHATAYGDPYFSTLAQRGNKNGGGSKGNKGNKDKQ